MLLSNNNTYVIADSRELESIDFTQYLESKDTVVYNVDRTKFILKYIGSAPSYEFQYPTLGPYTSDGLKQAQSDTEWPHGDEYFA